MNRRGTPFTGPWVERTASRFTIDGNAVNRRRSRRTLVGSEALASLCTTKLLDSGGLRSRQDITAAGEFKGLIGERQSEFKQLMTALANKHYRAGRMYSARQEHPDAFAARERDSSDKPIPRNRDVTMETPQPANSDVMVYCAMVIRELRDDLFEKCAIEYEDEQLKEAARKAT